MTTQKALKVFGQKDARVVSDWPMPSLRDDYIIVQVKAVALNPTDYKHIDYMPKAGCLVGCDYAGIVHEVGKDVTSVKKGDRIAGVAHGRKCSLPTNLVILVDIVLLVLLLKKIVN